MLATLGLMHHHTSAADLCFGPPCSSWFIHEHGWSPNEEAPSSKDLDDMDDVAAGIREALEAEHQWLLATIDEDRAPHGEAGLLGVQ